jgi:hydroxyacylglutathione hydrolase
MYQIITLRLSVSNAFLIKGPQANILVDTGVPNEEAKIIEMLAQNGVALNDVALIIHTHGHLDHCGSTAALLRKHKIPTLIHTYDAAMATSGNSGTFKASSWFGRFLKSKIEGIAYPPFIPNIVFFDDFDLSSFGIAARLVHTPGHTAGSISLLLNDGKAIIGDLLMGGFLLGKILKRYPNRYYFEDDPDAVEQSIKLLHQLKANTLYVGHGGPLAMGKVLRKIKCS